MSQWIKCSERFPEVGTPVLIRIPVGNHWNIESGEYRGHGEWYGAWCTSRGAGHCYKVTQWAEQPSEPECCKPTDEERQLLSKGSYTPEELWGGSRPTCPECIRK